MAEDSAGKDSQLNSGWVEGQDKVGTQARKANLFDKLKSIWHRSDPNVLPSIAQARPMTSEEIVQSHKATLAEAINAEKDPKIKGQLLKSRVNLRQREEKRQALQRKTATAAALAVGTAATIAAPGIVEGVANLVSPAGQTTANTGQLLEGANAQQLPEKENKPKTLFVKALNTDLNNDVARRSGDRISPTTPTAKPNQTKVNTIIVKPI